MLADMGADVIKVEPPAGDGMRKLGPPFANGESLTYLGANRNKRGIMLDLKVEADIAMAKELIRQADILVENFRPGVMNRLGLGWEAAHILNPRLIYCAISAFGQTGPWRDRPGVDGILQGMSGLMSVTGSPGSGPSKVQPPIVDMTSGFLAATAVLGALHLRNTTGHGQMLDISMYECALELQRFSFESYLQSGELPQPLGSAAPYAAPNEAYPASDGWLMVAAYHEVRWPRFCKLLGRPELTSDHRFKTLTDRVHNRQALHEEIDPVMRRQKRDHWLALLEANDILCGPVASYADVAASPQLAARGRLREVDHPVAGRRQSLGFGLGRSDATSPERYAPPMIGQHNTELLADRVAGIGWARK